MEKGYPIILRMYTKTIAAMGNKKTSVLDRKGKLRYPKCVMYQYQLNAAAYKVLLSNKANNVWPRTRGSKKN